MLISEITIDPARQRKELPKIDELAASMAEIGLINPIAVTQEGVLIAGERRLTAAKSLGWTHIDVRVFETADSMEAHVIELEENMKREPLKWQEYVQAVGEYKDITGGSVKEVRKALSLSETTLREILLVYANLEAVKTIENLTTAYNILVRQKAREQDAAKERLKANVASEASGTPSAPEDVTPTSRTKSEAILNEDFLAWAKSYKGDRFNFFHCDFPYGIGVGQGSGMAAARNDIEYDDSPETYHALLAGFCEAMPRLRADAAHMVFWFSMRHYTHTVTSLRSAGWTIEPYPLIWVRENKQGIIPDSARTFRRIYETALLCTYGDRKIVRATGNAFVANASKEYHPSAKPVSMLASLVDALCDDTTRLLDPTCGGADIVGIVKMKFPKATAIGIERDPNYASRARANYRRWTR